MKKILTLLFAAAIIASCCDKKASSPRPFQASAFDTVLGGKPAALYTLTNSNGMVVQLTNYGARVVSLWAPATDGFENVVRGFDNIEAYLNTAEQYTGAVAGRYANRIANGKFWLDTIQFLTTDGGLRPEIFPARLYTLTINDAPHHLNGGTEGFSTKVWQAATSKDVHGNNRVKMTYRSPDGVEGYPGSLAVEVTYTLTAGNALEISYTATTDAPTVLNLTSYCDFNLTGDPGQSADSHILTIAAGHFLPVDRTLIPTGQIAPVEGSQLDFRTPAPIGAYLKSDDAKDRYRDWLPDKTGKPGSGHAATLYEPSTGIEMDLDTDQPCIVFGGNQAAGKGFCSSVILTGEGFPDAPNHRTFSSAVLIPGQTYTRNCMYTFSVRN